MRDFVLSTIFVCMVAALHAADNPSPLATHERVHSLLRDRCFDCHSGDTVEGNFHLDRLLAQPADEGTRLQWWKALSNIRAGTMPPPGEAERLSSSESNDLSVWVKGNGLGIDPKQLDPGKVTIRRLNRTEYHNTILDLMGIDFNANVLFPPDDTGFGFDNVADALSLSPLLIEKYLAAAAEIVDRAVPKVTLVVPKLSFSSKDFRSETGEDGDDMRMDKPRHVAREIEVGDEGEYRVVIQLKSHGSFEFSPQRCKLSVLFDGEQVHSGEYAWDESKLHLQQHQPVWKAGKHRLEFDLTPIPLADGEQQGKDQFSELDVQSVVIEGPMDRSRWKHPAGYERFFPRDEPPSDLDGRQEYAREVLGRFTRSAFRRPPDPLTIDKLLSLAAKWLEQPDVPFEVAVSKAMIPVLASPRFLFRLESVDPATATDRFPLIDQHALAARLSYFFWSTMPDQELAKLADEGQLRSQLDNQMKRMLNDPKSGALIRNFGGQWLRTRDVEKVTIDALAAYGLDKEFKEISDSFRQRRLRRTPREGEPVDPETEQLRTRYRELSKIRDLFDGSIKSAMRQETELLLETIVREDRSVLEIVNPDYTFLNERLAKHYGIDGVEGERMRRVTLPVDSPRGGILTQGTMLTVTSNPTRTSPVKRGLYILENILGTPTPPAPPNVPALEDATGKFGGREPTLRELLAAHRESALCSSCHSRMDPLGLALENFNAVGIWRDTEKDTAIDAAGQLITGERFNDIRELKRIIVENRRADFYRCLAQKLLTYALGRGLDYYDEQTTDEIVDQLEQSSGRFSSLVHGIVHSAPFQNQRPPSSDAKQGD